MKKSTRSRRAKQNIEATPNGALLASLLGLAVFVLCAIIFMIASSIIATFAEDPREVTRIAGYAALYISALAAGFLTYKKCKGYVVLCGLFSGGLCFLLTFLLSLLVPRSISLMNAFVSFALRLIVVAASLCGALLASYKPDTKRRKKRKIKKSARTG